MTTLNGIVDWCLIAVAIICVCLYILGGVT
jgi:hypothetical protein